MKVRDISLMTTGAIVTVAVIVFASTLLGPRKVQAQGAAAAPGAVAIMITANPQVDALNLQSPAGVVAGGGVITVHDSAARTVKVVAYFNTINNSAGTALSVPTIRLSTPTSFTY